MIDDWIAINSISHIDTTSVLPEWRPIDMNDYVRDSEWNIETFFGMPIRKTWVEQNTSYPSISEDALEASTKGFN